MGGGAQSDSSSCAPQWGAGETDTDLLADALEAKAHSTSAMKGTDVGYKAHSGQFCGAKSSANALL